MIPLKLVILGGTGFVGRHLVSRLAAEGHAVTLLSRNLGAHDQRLLPPGVVLRETDVYDPDALRAAFAGADAVVNLVGILNEQGDNGRGFRRAHVELTTLVIAAMQLAVSSNTRALPVNSSGREPSRTPRRTTAVSASVPDRIAMLGPWLNGASSGRIVAGSSTS